MKRFALALVTLAVCAGAQAASDEVEMNLVSPLGVGQSVGTVKITETDKGLEFAPHLNSLPPGEHGFHVHTNGSCQPALKEGKPRRQKPQVATLILNITVSTKGRTAWGIWAICPCWW